MELLRHTLKSFEFSEEDINTELDAMRGQMRDSVPLEYPQETTEI